MSESFHYVSELGHLHVSGRKQELKLLLTHNSTRACLLSTYHRKGDHLKILNVDALCFLFSGLLGGTILDFVYVLMYHAPETYESEGTTHLRGGPSTSIY